jgi:hypothetical protein
VLIVWQSKIYKILNLIIKKGNTMLRKITLISILSAIAGNSYAFIGNNVGYMGNTSDVDISNLIGKIPENPISNKVADNQKSMSKLRQTRADILTVTGITYAVSADHGRLADTDTATLLSTVYYNIGIDGIDNSKTIISPVIGSKWGSEHPGGETKLRVRAKVKGTKDYNQELDVIATRINNWCLATDINAAVLCSASPLSNLAIKVADTKHNRDLLKVVGNKGKTLESKFSVDIKGWHSKDIDDILYVQINWKMDDNAFGQVIDEYRLTEMNSALYTKNYNQSLNTSSGIYFTIPDNGIVSTNGNSFPEWTGAHEWNRITVPVIDKYTNQTHKMELELSKSTACGTYVMNGGNACSKGGTLAVRVSDLNKDKLPKSAFKGEFDVVVQGWHDLGIYKKLRINIDWSNGSSLMPVEETISLTNTASDNNLPATVSATTKKYGGSLSVPYTSVGFLVAPWSDAKFAANSLSWGTNQEVKDSPIEVPVINIDDGKQYILKIKGQSSNQCYWHALNAAISCYDWERYAYLEINNGLNEALPAGSYKGDFDLVAQGWHDSSFVKRIKVNIDWRKGEKHREDSLPETL